ncbi:MAG: Mut7-C RNAse domain-containing protein [Nitriliruptorales bacterium]
MRAKYASVRFYGDLGRLAWEADRFGQAEVTFDVARSVKDVVESCGVPHTEIELLLVNGESAGFDRLIDDGDRISVFPPFHQLDVEHVSRVRPPPLGEPRFLLDIHLGRLAGRLRLLGFDCVYGNDDSDERLATVARREQRWLLTRDRGLLMRSSVTHGYCLRSQVPTQQAVEVVQRFDLAGRLAPFSRCVRCNGLLQEVDKGAVEHRLEARTRSLHDEFRECVSCRRLYWKGSHHPYLTRFVDYVRSSCGA